MAASPPTSSKPPPAHQTPLRARQDELAAAREVIRAEAAVLEHLAVSLDDRFLQALDLIQTCADAGGTVLVAGLGKSGLIGAKISATLASLGVPSHPVHPSEASHGDLGRFRPIDLALCLSHSGETDEVVALASILRQDRLPIVSITGGNAKTDTPSSLERLSSVTLTTGVRTEAGDAGYSAPTCSTTAMLALGDALAVAVARRRNFTHADFARRHPGGTLGALLRPVRDVIRFRVGPACPAIDDRTGVMEAFRDVTGARRAGALLLVDASGALSGIFTDADLRRRLTSEGPGPWLASPIAEVMTRTPTVLGPDALIRDAIRIMREKRLDELPVVDAQGRPLGLLDVQDLVALRLVKDES